MGYGVEIEGKVLSLNMMESNSEEETRGRKLRRRGKLESWQVEVTVMEEEACMS